MGDITLRLGSEIDYYLMSCRAVPSSAAVRYRMTATIVQQQRGGYNHLHMYIVQFTVSQRRRQSSFQHIVAYSLVIESKTAVSFIWYLADWRRKRCRFLRVMYPIIHLGIEVSSLRRLPKSSADASIARKRALRFIATSPTDLQVGTAIFSKNIHYAATRGK